MPTTSPNMGLTVPLVGDAGTGYATNISAALNLIDAHNHTSGKGLPVPTAGLNINADLAFAGFQATGLVAAVFNQLANTTTNLTNQALTNVLGRPYWRDNSGVIKQVTLAGDPISGLSALTLQAIAAPATPASGFGVAYIDSTSKALAVKNDAGVVSHTARTLAVVASQFVTGLNDAGVLSTAQVNFSDLTGSIPAGQAALGSLLLTAVGAPGTPAAGKGSVYVDSTSKNLAVKNDAGTVNHGVQTKAAVASNWIRSIADDGSSLQSQPAFSDVSGTASLTTQVTGLLPILNGGTGQSTAGAATDALHQGTFTIAAVNGTTDLSTVSGLYGTVTGSGVFTTTALGTVAAGTVRICTIGAGCTWALTNGASLLTPGAQGLGLNSGDTCIAISQGSGTWRVFPVYSSLYGFTEAAAGTVGVQYSGATPLRVSGSYVGVFGVLNVGASGSAPAAGIYFNANVGSGLFQAATDDLGWSAAGTQQLHVNANGLIHNTRHQTGKGAAVASATTITLGNDGNVFPITGTTVITTITTTNWQAGSRVTLIFGTGTASQVTNAGNITFRSGTSLTTTTNGAWDFIYDGTAWRCQN